MSLSYRPKKRHSWSAPCKPVSPQLQVALTRQLAKEHTQRLRQLKAHYQARPTARVEKEGVTLADKRVVLTLGQTTEAGISVTLQIGNEGELPQLETTGWLPLPAALLTTLQSWQRAYRQLSQPVTRLQAPAVQVTNISYQEIWNGCLRTEQNLVAQINGWLNSALFRPVRETLLAALSPTDAIRFVLQTDDMQIRALPLHRWDWFERYPYAELVLSETSYQQRSHPTTGSNKVRILAILGNSEGLDVEGDRQLLAALPDVALTCLVEPTRSQLNDTLWEQPWDILFFAGHSIHAAGQQKLRLNATEDIALSELKYGLKKVCDRGLKLAIFNACDGLPLLKKLGNDSLPSTIVMRHPVSDVVAQTFLKYFLTSFSQGSSLHQAVREAREKLQGIESQFPFATWLPVLCQASSALPLTWESLGANSSRLISLPIH